MISNEKFFKKAAEILRRDGLAKGHFGPVYEEVRAPRCTVGAMYCAARALGMSDYDVGHNYNKLFQEAAGIDSYGFTSEWNDLPERRVEDVLAIFDRLAEVKPDVG